MSLRRRTFCESDWTALAPYWYPVAFSHEVAQKPIAAQLLDQRLVLYRLANGKVTAARDLCLHRGIPLSMGFLEGDALVCAYHGFRYDGEGRCVCIPAHPGAAIPPKLKLQTYPTEERYGLVWTRLVNDELKNLPEFDEWLDPDYLTGASKLHRIGGFSRTPDRRIPGCWSLCFCTCRNFWRPHQSGSTNLRSDTDSKWFSGRLLKYGQQLSKASPAS